MQKNKKNILILIGLFVICGIIGYFVTSAIKQKDIDKAVDITIQEDNVPVDVTETDVDQNDTVAAEVQTQDASGLIDQEQTKDGNQTTGVVRQNEPKENVNKQIRKEEKKVLTEEERRAIEEKREAARQQREIERQQREIDRQQREEQNRIAREKKAEEDAAKKAAAEAAKKAEAAKRAEAEAAKKAEAEAAKRAAAEAAKKADEEKRQQEKLAQDKLKSEIQSIVVSGQKSSKVPDGCKIKVNGSTIDYGNFRMGLRSKAYSKVKVNSIDVDKDGKVRSVSVSATVNQSDE